MEASKYRVLVVDDEDLVRNMVGTILTQIGYSFKEAVNGDDALEKMRADRFNAVITDIKMPGMDGILLTRAIAEQYPEVPVMVLTGHGDEYSAGTAISAGAREFMTKPFLFSEFTIRVQKLIKDAEVLNELKEEKEEKDLRSLKEELQVIVKSGK